jgi:hypothetical protein
MKLVKCVSCKVFLVHNKEEYKRHEARFHAYQASSYEQHHHRLLSDADFNGIVAKGEAKFQHALFVPDNPINLRHR